MKHDKKDLPPVNGRIKADKVRLIDENGQQLGVMPLRSAMAAANAANLDLVQIAPGETPVCRIVDSGRYLFERKKQEREQSRRQRELQVETKEVQIRPVTDDADLLVKARKARGFLDQGDRVKLSVRFRGREQTHKQEGHKIVRQFLEAVGEHKVDRELIDRGKEWSMVMAPLRSKADLLKNDTKT